MQELTEVLKALGFGPHLAAVLWACATFWLCQSADKRLSAQGRRAISGWLDPKPYDKAAVAGAIVELFDWVYTRPLLAWRAFFRSFLITMSIFVVVMVEFGFSRVTAVWNFDIGLDTSTTVISNIASDYLALFIIKRILNANDVAPLKALLLGPLIGIALVIFMNILTLFGGNLIAYGSLLPPDEEPLAEDSKAFSSLVISAAMIVHLWLPFFALCVGLLKGLNYILLTTNKVQWFLDRGKDHPLDAIGFVAAPLIFLIAVAVQWLVSK